MTASASTWPARPRVRVRTFVITLVLVAFTVFAARKVGFSPSTFWEVWSNPLWEKFWPIPWEWVLDGDIAEVDDDTFQEIYGRAITADDLLASGEEPTSPDDD